MLRGCRQPYYVIRFIGSPTLKPYVFSDSVLCMGKMRDDLVATWKNKIERMVFGKQSLRGYEANRRHAEGVRVENIHRNHDVGLLREDSKFNERLTV